MHEKENLIIKIRSTIKRFNMLTPGEKILVAVSGGPDSVALLHALWSIRDELQITLHVAHLNHSIREEESDADEEYVRQLASELNIPFVSEKIDVPALRRTLRLSEEEAARLVRYDFLMRTAVETGACKIALGHTADDQVETILLNLIRGTGVDGLAGMPAVRGKIIRSLIETRRSEIEEYTQKHYLHPRTDLTNLVPAYSRNRVRLRLLPMMREEFNPDIDSALLRLSELAREDSAYLNLEAEDKLEGAIIGVDEKTLRLDAESVIAMPLSIRRRVIRQAMKRLVGDLVDVGFVHIEKLISLLDASVNFRYDLPGSIFSERSGNVLFFRTEKKEESFTEYNYELPRQGEVCITEINACVHTEMKPERVEPFREPESLGVVLDNKRIVGKLTVRSWLPGDRIHPLGLAGSKKVQDVFVDRKIPRGVRHRIPIITDQEKILWIAGLVLSEDAKVTDITEESLLLTLMHESDYCE